MQSLLLRAAQRGLRVPLKILLADDSMTAQSMGKRILTDAGYDVVTVSNGAAAVRKIPELQPDLALLDVYMPGYNGLEVCERMKASPKTAQIPVLLTVGKLEPFSPEEGMRVKAEGVIIKPFEATDLTAVVSKVAERIQALQPAPAPPAPAPIARPVEEMPIEPPIESAQDVEIPPAAAAMPAFGDDLLETGATSYGEEAATNPEPPAGPAQFDDFAIQLEPLPMDSEGEHRFPQASGDPLHSRIEQPTVAAVTGAPAAPEFPLEFELDDLANGEQPASEEVLVDLSPFTSQPAEPAPAAERPTPSEAASVGAADQCTEPHDWEDGPSIELDELMGEPEPAVTPEPAPMTESAAAAQELERVLHEPDQDEQSAASAVEEPAIASTPEMSTEQEVADVQCATPSEAAGSIIDLGSLLNEPQPAIPVAPQGAALEMPTSEPAVNSEQPLAVQSQEASTQLDADQAIVERIAERVLARLKPALIEEIRNALNES